MPFLLCHVTIGNLSEIYVNVCSWYVWQFVICDLCTCTWGENQVNEAIFYSFIDVVSSCGIWHCLYCCFSAAWPTHETFLWSFSPYFCLSVFVCVSVCVWVCVSISVLFCHWECWIWCLILRLIFIALWCHVKGQRGESERLTLSLSLSIPIPLRLLGGSDRLTLSILTPLLLSHTQ